MNIPNLLTLSRFFLSALMLGFLGSSAPWSKTAALVAFGMAALTDALDGYLARNVYGVTPIGSLLDPLADKVMICCALVGFVELQLIPAWIVVLILSREFLVTGLRVLAGTRGQIISAGTWGKHKTGWQIAVIVILLLGLCLRDDWAVAWLASAPLAAANADVWFHAIAYVVAVGAALITVVSGILYFIDHRDLIVEHLNQPGVRTGDNK
ncbi:MAG: CDP-diacylglycerol--glycerol-3-phosphate 3-phosphatidyltransferase [Kiritimatiellia bacterium]|nr:CDP-diacylglycerol--glycerol-3-phosphate 3-phosphatidyltransferase [Kiritimatiellia bacterium]